MVAREAIETHNVGWAEARSMVLPKAKAVCNLDYLKPFMNFLVEYFHLNCRNGDLFLYNVPTIIYSNVYFCLHASTHKNTHISMLKCGYYICR